MATMPQVFDPSRPELRLVVGADRVDASAQGDRDEHLVAAFEAGASGSGERLYDRLTPIVESTLVRVLGGRGEDHADLVQAVFEQIVRTLLQRKFARRCSLAGWAATIACHVALNALRSRRRERAVIERRRPDDDGKELPEVIERVRASAVEAQLGARDELAAVRAQLAQMAPERVTALLLHAMGHDIEEIAALTSTSVAAAQSRLSRARRELRERLGRDAVENANPVRSWK